MELVEQSLISNEDLDVENMDVTEYAKYRDQIVAEGLGHGLTEEEVNDYLGSSDSAFKAMEQNYDRIADIARATGTSVE
jgi:hypothetical protein